MLDLAGHVLDLAGYLLDLAGRVTHRSGGGMERARLVVGPG